MTMTEATSTNEHVSTTTYNARALRAALTATDATRSTDLSRPVLTAWLVETSADHDAGTATVRAVTTDSYALTVADATYRVDRPTERRQMEGTRMVFGAGVKLRDLGPLNKSAMQDNADLRIQVDLERLGAGANLFATVAELGAAGTSIGGVPCVDEERRQHGAGFPEWEQLVPKDPEISAEGGAFNPNYLAAPAASMKAVYKALGVRPSNQPNTAVKVEQLQPLKPSLFSWTYSTGGPDKLDLSVRHLVMPIRCS